MCSSDLLLHHAILLLFVFIICPFTEIFNSGGAIASVMSPKEVWRAIAVVFAVALPCDEGDRGFAAFTYGKLGAANTDTRCNLIVGIDDLAHHIAAKVTFTGITGTPHTKSGCMINCVFMPISSLGSLSIGR